MNNYPLEDHDFSFSFVGGYRKTINFGFSRSCIVSQHFHNLQLWTMFDARALKIWMLMCSSASWIADRWTIGFSLWLHNYLATFKGRNAFIMIISFRHPYIRVKMNDHRNAIEHEGPCEKKMCYKRVMKYIRPLYSTEASAGH